MWKCEWITQCTKWITGWTEHRNWVSLDSSEFGLLIFQDCTFLRVNLDCVICMVCIVYMVCGVCCVYSVSTVYTALIGLAANQSLTTLIGYSRPCGCQ